MFLLYINEFPYDVIFNIAIYAGDTTLYSKCDQISDLWQQLELASELESYLQDPVDQGSKWLVDFNAGKTQLVSFDWSNNTDAIYVKMDGFVLEENGTLKLSLSLKLPLICSMNFLSPEVALCLYKSTIRPRME